MFKIKRMKPIFPFVFAATGVDKDYRQICLLESSTLAGLVRIDSIENEISEEDP